EGFPWLTAKTVFIGHAKVLAMRVSYSGELAFELHVPNERLYLVWTILARAGEPMGLGRFGNYAAESMRLEKGYRHFKADLLVEYDPYESGLERFVRPDKGDFIPEFRSSRGVLRLLADWGVGSSIPWSEFQAEIRAS